jgi:hypothetical protein
MKAAGAKRADPDRDRHHLSRGAITGAVAGCLPLYPAQAGARPSSRGAVEITYISLLPRQQKKSRLDTASAERAQRSFFFSLGFPPLKAIGSSALGGGPPAS